MAQNRKPRGFFVSNDGLEKLEAKRLAKGYSHETLAQEANVTLDRVKRLFNPHWGYKVQRDAIEKIANALDLRPTDIVAPNEWNLTLRRSEPKQTAEACRASFENIPRSGVSFERFFGRSQELEKLHQLLQQENRVVIAAIVGMGGVGKTELAIQYALQHLADYPAGVCWLPGKEVDVGIELVKFARSQFAVNPPEHWDLKTQVDFCWRRWQLGEVLVVLDDITDYKSIEPYLPPVKPRFKVLVTTRLQLGVSVEQLSLNILDESAALQLLMSLVGEERIQQELDEAKQLCVRLEYLPLGLELVGRYLRRKRDLSLSEMLGRLDAKGLNDRSLQKPKSEDDMTGKLGVKAAFELSWETLSDAAKQLGCLLSVFAPAPIPWDLVEQTAITQDSDDLEEAQDELLNLHLLQHIGQETYRLHQLIREFLHEKLEQLPQANELKKIFVSAMVEVSGQIPEPGLLTRNLLDIVSYEIPHLAEATTVWKDWIADEDGHWLFLSLGRFYNSQGFYEQAEPWYKQCLAFNQIRLNADHLYIVGSLSNLAELQRNQGCYDEAENNFLHALELIPDWKEADAVEVPTIVNNLALLYEDQGRYSEAEELFSQALKLSYRLRGEQDFITALIINNLGVLYLRQECYGKAESLLRQSLKIRRSLWGHDSPDVANSLNNLAALYTAQGCYQKAGRVSQRALKLTYSLRGEEHPEVALSLCNRASFYRTQGRYKEAESLYTRALGIDKQLLGEKHIEVANDLRLLAELHYVQHHYQDAENMYLQALDIYEQRLGIEHPYTINSSKKVKEIQSALLQSKFSIERTDFVVFLNLSKKTNMIAYKQQPLNELKPKKVSKIKKLGFLQEIKNLQQR